MKKVGILYDNISGNTGDVAIGLSVKKILRKLGVSFDELVPGRFNPNDYDVIVIGGGYLLRQSPDFFYDKFKISGKHILNASGILGNPNDLHYLNNYRYITVRSKGDKEKLNYLKKDVKVVPDSTIILDDLKNFNLKIKKPSIGIHVTPPFLTEKEEKGFATWISSLGYNIYLLPITHYSHDFVYLEKLAKKIDGSTVLPILRAEEIFTIIGKFDYFISCSLHGTIFSYAHNVPFIAANLEKIRFFMEDRYLEKYLFSNFDTMKKSLQHIMNNKTDYSKSLDADKQILDKHIKKIGTILSHFMGKKRVIRKKMTSIQDLKQQYESQIHHLQLNAINSENRVSSIKEELVQSKDYNSTLKQEIQNKEDELTKSKDYISKLEQEIQNKEDELTKSKDYISKLEQEIQNKEDELTKAKNTASKLSGEINDKNEIIKNLKTQLNELKENIELLQEHKPKYYSSRL